MNIPEKIKEMIDSGDRRQIEFAVIWAKENLHVEAFEKAMLAKINLNWIVFDDLWKSQPATPHTTLNYHYTPTVTTTSETFYIYANDSTSENT